jgi:hypothetical protein
LDIELLTLEEGRIRQVRMTHADGETVVVSRGDTSQSDYVMEGLGEEETMKPSYEVNSAATTFADLELDDVQLLEEGKDYPEPQSSVSMETFDGLIVNVTILELDGKRLARLSAEHQSVEVAELDSKTDGEGAEAETAETEAEQADTTKSPAEEAALLNERWQGWLYEVAEYQLDAIARRRPDLLEPPAAEENPPEEKPEGES